MRRSEIVSGTLLILSIIDFSLTAPVLVQEKRQTCADVVHIPHDVITVEKRGPEEVEKLLEMPFKMWEKPVESSDAHASSGSSLPLGPNDHGSMDDVKAPGQNPASSPADPAASTSSLDLLSEYWTNMVSPPLPRPIPAAQKNIGLFGQVHGNQVDYIPERPTDAELDRGYWTTLADQPPLKLPKLASSEDFGKAHASASEDQMVHAQQPNLNPESLKDSGLADWFSLDEVLPLLAQPEHSSSPKEFDHLQAHEDPVPVVPVPAQQPSPESLKDLDPVDWSGLGDIIPLETLE